MSKLNPLNHVSSKFDDERLAGGLGLKAAKQDNLSLLRRVVMANLLWENVAYADGLSVSNEIEKLIPLCEPVDVFEVALEARLKQKLRHVPLFIIKEMAKHEEHKKYVAEALVKVITRADMITDFVALYWKDGKKPLSAQIKKGLAMAFDNFNEYQFAKYDRNSAVKLRDVMFLVHPHPKQGKEELYSKIASRTLTTPDTWEVALSTGKDKKETWTRLISEGKIGGLAMLRNLRNMKDALVDKEVVYAGLEKLHSHMLLPLDFLKAARINPEFESQIEDAMLTSYSHLPRLTGSTLFIVDVSGSMGGLTSGQSEFSRLDQACAMAMLAANQCTRYTLVATAGNDGNGKGAHELIRYPVKGFGLTNQIYATKRNIGGGGIFTRQALEWCKENVGDTFDRIIIFSDSQDCDRVNKIPKPYGKRNYIVDVSAHMRGVNYKGIWDAEISGWSEHFLTFIAALEGIENTFQIQE